VTYWQCVDALREGKIGRDQFYYVRMAIAVNTLTSPWVRIMGAVTWTVVIRAAAFTESSVNNRGNGIAERIFLKLGYVVYNDHSSTVDVYALTIHALL